MTVYVDDMKARFGKMIMCHMIADTDNELHAMAAHIGVARRYHQTVPKAMASHYDICLSMRAKAIAAGAIEITLRDCALMTINRKRSNPSAPLVTPAEGLHILQSKWKPAPMELSA